MLLGEFVSSILFLFLFLFYFLQFKMKNKFKGDNGFGTVCKIDAGYYSQGFSFQNLS